MALVTYKKSPFGAKAEIMYLTLYDADDDEDDDDDNNNNKGSMGMAEVVPL